MDLNITPYNFQKVINGNKLEIKDNNDKSFSEIERLLFCYEHRVHISIVPLQQQI